MSTMDSDHKLIINDTPKFYHVNHGFNGVTVSFRCVDIPVQNAEEMLFCLKHMEDITGLTYQRQSNVRKPSATVP